MTHNTSLPPLAMIAALDSQQLIGHKNSIPWHFPADMKHFRRHTIGHAVLMGSQTYHSLKKPLPGRTNIVLSRNPDLNLPGTHTFTEFEEALAFARSLDPCPFVIGGAQLYQIALPHTTLLYLTHIAKTYETPPSESVFFPPVSWEQWQVIEESLQPPLRFVTYQRILPSPP